MIEEVQEWQNRPLDSLDRVIFFDALRIKIHDEDLVRNITEGQVGSDHTQRKLATRRARSPMTQIEQATTRTTASCRTQAG